MYIMWRRRERLRGAAAQCISLPAIRSVFSVIVIFYGSVFRRFPGGDAHCTGGTNRGRRRNSERGPPLRAPCRYALIHYSVRVC